MTRTYCLWITLVFFISVWTVIVFRYIFPMEHHLLSLTNLCEVSGRPGFSQLRKFPSGIRIINNNIRSHLVKNYHQGTNSIRRKGKTNIYWQNSTHVGGILARRAVGFVKDWCRIRRARLDWREYLSPCHEHTRFGKRYLEWGIENRTNATNSLILNWDIRPAGEFSRFFIQSKTSTNESKRIGGDAWRIRVYGVASVSPTVFDNKNGTYEVLFLLMEPGFYQLQIVLDYSLCDGQKDPPVDWYRRGNIQGKNQPDGTLRVDSPYLIQPFGDGKPIVLKIPRSRYSRNIQSSLDPIRREFFNQKDVEKQTLCHVGCRNLVWDGYGRWVNDTWRPFVEDEFVKREPHEHEGILWIYGDSVSKMFKEALSTGKFYEICEKIFKQCQITYSWIYNMDGYLKGKEKAPPPDGKDYDHKKVIGEIEKVLYDRRMDEHSVLLLNWGIHFAAAVNFSNYRKLIDEFIETVKLGKRKGYFKGKIIWRTTTAIFRERYPEPHKDVGRFLTFPRILLYNAYATSAMCRAGIDVIDVYPMSNSFPPGTLSKKDPVHYEGRALGSVEALIHRKFKS